MKTLAPAELAALIDAALLRPEATRAEVEAFCAQAARTGFHGVCVHGSRVELAYARLEETALKVIALVGFPLGTSDSDVKRYEAEVAIDQGAHEIFFVVNAGRIKDGDRAGVLREMRDIAEAADERPVTACWRKAVLTEAEEAIVCELALDSGAQSVCPATPADAAISSADVQRIRASLGPKFGLLAAGEFRDALSAVELIEAGAGRLVTPLANEVLQSLGGESGGTL